jgi:hypothetical protein
MDTIAQLARTEAARAAIVAGEDQTSDSNVVTGAQIAAVIGAGTALTLTAGGPIVIPPTAITTRSSAVVKLSATISGAFGAGATACVAQLQASGDGGATWTAIQTVDVSGPDTAGSAAGQIGGAAFAWTAAAVEGTAEQFRVQVAPVGGSFTTTVGHGGLVAEEA